MGLLRAEELRSRILGWGDRLRTHFTCTVPTAKAELGRLDLNRITTGTLDSISEQTLSDYRISGDSAPIIVDDFIAKGLLLRHGLFQDDRFRDDSLRDYVAYLNGTNFGINARKLTDTVTDLYNRLYNDQADVAGFEHESRADGHPYPGVSVALKAIDDYRNELEKALLVDYAQLAAKFLERLRSGTLDDFRSKIRHLFVDEYQDTNLLQESIYFEIAEQALADGGSMTVVGDDDQSLYRFRGATVDLFRQFPERFNSSFRTAPSTVFLSANYRSTQAIVDFCNNFVTIDPGYQTQRVANKPRIHKARVGSLTEWPALGLFRSDRESLARDLAQFVHDVVRGEGVDIPMANGGKSKLRIDADEGSAADCVLLCSSPLELDGSGRERLPKLLKDELHSHDLPIEVFNPRGRDLPSVDSVGRLCGLMLECLDPASKIQDGISSLPEAIQNQLRRWRGIAARARNGDRHLDDFVSAWQNRRPLHRCSWQRDTHLNDLCYKLVYWIPDMQNDVEGLVYLEAVTRAINGSGASGLSRFRSRFVRDVSDPGLEQASVRDLIWNAFVPIAAGSVDIDEDLLETLPPDRLPVMSIHQAKGLEFPLVIVDVGSDFNTDHWTQAFKRFPRDGGLTCRLEDEVRPYTPLGRDARSELDRAFDDLVRQYFVSYSRARDVLLLVGTDAVKERIPNKKPIPNIATGWDRSKSWEWGAGLPALRHI